MTAEPPASARSFRDPAGFVVRMDGRVLRSVQPEFLEEFELFLASAAATQAMEAGELARSERVPEKSLPYADPCGGVWFEHEPIPFASHPFEWPASMLHAAASTTLRLAEAALSEGFGIKDATPYNILFRGTQPVFIDVLSFERRDPLDARWLAYAQFARTFLLPLAAERFCGIPVHQSLAAHRDGLEPEQLYRSLGSVRRLMPPLLNLVSIPTWFGRKSTPARVPALHAKACATSVEQARYILAGLLRSCGKQLKKLAPPSHADSTWSGYLDHKSLYTAEQLTQKEAFVRKALYRRAPGSVLDVGANEGHFSMLAAKSGSRVVAIDSDPAVVDSLYRRATAERADVLPLVVDFARPTPAVGWRNQECDSFLDRAAGHFDMVLMLAVLHHLLVTERVPLEEILAVAEELTTDSLVIEFVEPEDPMFRTIARGRDALYAHLTREHFESAAARWFEQLDREKISGLNRWLYLFRRR